MSETIAIRHKRGGLYFEEFVIGQFFEHSFTRTVTQMDNMLFSNMTLNPQPLHIDRHFCAQETEWGEPIMNSLFTLGLIIGISLSDLLVGTTIANLGMTDVKFPHPLFEGDTIHCTTEVVAKRRSKSRPGAGIVELHHRAYSQDENLSLNAIVRPSCEHEPCNQHADAVCERQKKPIHQPQGGPHGP